MTHTVSTARYDPQPLPATYTSLFHLPPSPGALTESLKADCVVVGMGITGSSAAIHLAQKGVSVVQLEAGEVSAGASGRAFGLVVPYGKHNEARVLKDFGPELGERYIAAVAQGPDLVRSLVETFDIPDAIHGLGWVLAPFTPQATASLAKRAEYWRKRGADVDFLEGKAAADLIGSELYPAGMLHRMALTINPLAYSCGLAAAASRLGVAQFCHSPATAMERSAGAWRIRTPQGQVTCQQVLICTDAYVGRLWPGLSANFIRIRGYQAVTEVIAESKWPRILPGAAAVTDTRHTWSGVKKLPDGRLHLSAGGPCLPADRPADLEGVNARLKELYPWLGPVQWHEQWGGWVGITPKQHPTIKSLDKGVWAALGYSGRGIAAATLMGRELAGLATSPASHQPMVPVETSRPLPVEPAARLVAAGIINWYRLADSLSRRA